MKKKILVACCALCLPFLSGCEIESRANVNIMSVMEDEPMVGLALVGIEVTSCHARNSQLESNSLLEAKGKLAYVFPGARFEKCTPINAISSVARFTIPYQIGGIREQCDPEKMCVYHSKNKIWLNVKIGEKALARMLEAEQDATSTPTYRMSFDVYNDSGINYRGSIPCAYVDDEPKSGLLIAFNHGKRLRLTLSNVHIDQLKTGDYVSMMGIDPIKDKK